MTRSSLAYEEERDYHLRHYVSFGRQCVVPCKVVAESIICGEKHRAAKNRVYVHFVN